MNGGDALDLDTVTVFGFAFVNVLAPTRRGPPAPGVVLEVFIAEVLAGGFKRAALTQESFAERPSSPRNRFGVTGLPRCDGAPPSFTCYLPM